MSGDGGTARRRVLFIAAVALVMIAVTVGWALSRRPAPVDVDQTAAQLADPGALLVRDTRTGQVAVVHADGSRTQTGVRCARVFAAGSVALCLRPDPATVNTFQLAVLDANLAELRTVPLNGVPTRARVSADGRMLAWTMFVSGDSYLSSGFSTRTGILDRDTGVLVSTLEDFILDGRRLASDANIWGVSFAADDTTFYATMATGRHLYLVRGDVATQTLSVLADGVECPSLSPDGSRLVYKRRLPDRSWELWVYQLDSGQRTRLAEPGSVDDQAVWLDDTTVAYGKVRADRGVDVWSVPADGSGAPTVLAENAESPSPLG